MLRAKYQEGCDWVDKCTLEQYHLIAELVLEDISLEDLKRQVLKS